MRLTIMDTNVLSDLRKPRPHPGLVEWVAAADPRSLAIAVPSIVEIARGIGILQARNASAAAPLTDWLDRIRATERILPLDATAAELLGRMAAVPGLRNLFLNHPGAARPQLGGDLAIAAIALTHSAVIATRNLRDFRLIATHFQGLAIVDPYGTGQ